MKREVLIGFCLIWALYLYVLEFIVFDKWQYDIATYGWLYWLRFYGAKFVPVLIVTCYLMRSQFHSSIKKALRVAVRFSVPVAIGAGIFLFVCYLMGIPVSVFAMGYTRWDYASMVEWLFAYALFYVLAKKSFGVISASAFSMLAVSACTMLYELPTYNVQAMRLGHYLDWSYPLFIATEFVSFAFMCYMLFKVKWKPTRLFWIAISIFVVHGMYWAFYPTPDAGYLGLKYGSEWLPRLLIVFIICAALLGIRGKNENLVKSKSQ